MVEETNVIQEAKRGIGPGSGAWQTLPVQYVLRAESRHRSSLLEDVSYWGDFTAKLTHYIAF